MSGQNIFLGMTCIFSRIQRIFGCVMKCWLTTKVGRCGSSATATRFRKIFCGRVRLLTCRRGCLFARPRVHRLLFLCLCLCLCLCLLFHAKIPFLPDIVSASVYIYIILELCPISKGKYGHSPQIPARLCAPQKIYVKIRIKRLTADKQKVKLKVRVLFF